MNPKQRQKISKIVEDVFRTMVFMFAVPMDERDMADMTWNLHGWVRTAMEFSGPSSGSIDMVFPGILSKQIAANMLGVEADCEQAARRSGDAVAELLNVLCGHLLTEYAGTTPVFDLTTPQLSDIDATEMESLCDTAADRLTFSIDGKPVFITVTFRERVS